MFLDIRTIIFMAAVLCLTVAGLLLLAWLQNRAERVLLWWSGGYVLSGIGLSLAVPRGAIPAALSIDLANALMLIGAAMCWAGTRSFNGRTTPVAWLPVGAIVWVVVLHLTSISESLGERIALFSVIYACYTLAAGLELWRGRSDGLSSRYSLVGSLVVLAGFYVGRVVVGLTFPLPATIQDAAPSVAMTLFFSVPIILAMANAILIVAVTKERAEAAQRRIAEIDPLTGQLNRGATISRAAAGLAAGHGAILLFDLDRFKQINDRFGHPAGDRVLMTFARAATENLREGDVFGRIGGEEFLAFMPGADNARAMAAAERIRAAFAATRTEVGGKVVPSTVSIGIAVATAPVPDIDPLLIRADRALYVAKENGRDRVQFAAPKVAA